MPITKEEINELGFQRLVNDKSHYVKPGWALWVQEISPGDTYNKVAITKDFHGVKPAEYEYFYSMIGVQRYMEEHEPKNTVNIETLEGAWNAPYPAPPNYNDKLYHAPDTGY